jgi:hypothetical protein
MNPRALRCAALLLGGILLFTRLSLAHSPFDCSARVIIHADAAEVMLTVGTTLGENFLRPANLSPGQLPSGHPFALAPGFATNLFTASADGKILEPREADVITDGLEFQFHFEYALAPAQSLGIETKFIPALNAPRNAPLVLTDENGNIFASTILSPEKTGTEFALPEKLFPAAANVLPASRRQNQSEILATAATRESPPSAAEKSAPSFAEFLKLGIGHILNVEAFDHLLFLTALLLGCRKLKPMLLVVTGFTVAHSVTLALAALNLVTISSRIVEPLIAASIIFVAAENFRSAEKSWHRYALTCGFGLIHGFGFASALRASGLAGTGTEIIKPLVAFNIGVEIGQLVVAALVLPLLLLLNRWPWFARHGARMISALVIVVAAFWLWQRLR